MPKVVSLFSGAGGLDWGFREAGFEIVFANDVLAHAVATYSRNFGLRVAVCGRVCEAQRGVVVLGDVASVDFRGLAGEGVDVVVGGPPCQDFSIIRGPEWDRRGIEVRRGRLYAHFVRALAVLQPKVFVFENVPGLVSANRGQAYRTILEDFENLNLRWEEVKRSAGIVSNNGGPTHGYKIVFSEIVDFATLGVPQRRDRLIVVGVRKDLAKDLNTWRELRAVVAKALSGEVRAFRKYPLTPIEVFEGKVLPELQNRYVEVMREWEGVWAEVGTEKALRWKAEVWDSLTLDIVRDYLRANKAIPSSEEELEEAWKEHRKVLEELGYLGRRVCADPPADGTCNPPEESPEVVERMKRIPPGENHEFVRGTRWEVEGRSISLVYRRLHPLKPSYTIVAYGGGGTHGYHYERSKATLTLRERARLQTFPDGFLFSGGRAEVRAQIGEAVPPLAGKRIAEAVAELLKLTELL